MAEKNRRVLLVSNRLPITIERRKGRLHYRQSFGGLATALSTIYKKYDYLWIGWPGIFSSSREKISSKLLSQYNCYPVFLSKKNIDKYYYGFCNGTLWPLFHYFPAVTRYDTAQWECYLNVNKLFCERITKIAKPNDIIWIHDYHLLLLPNLLRKKLPDSTIGFFLHIPFPPLEIFRLLPWRKELLNGMLGADLIGFHTYEYSANFLNNVLYLLGVDHELGKLLIENRIVKTDVFPLGINFEQFFNCNKDENVKKEIQKFQSVIGKRKIIFSIDRLDYIKGIPERLDATLSALYTIADVALITPIRDGMNLTAKEYIAACSDGKGVLILSEMAGAAKELGEALIVNPNNKEEIATTLKKALEMPVEEQIARNREMQKRLRFYDVEYWIREFLEKLCEVKKAQEVLNTRLVSTKILQDLITDYYKSSSRIIFLDYDGTLVPFADKPENAKPDTQILNIIEQLAEVPENEVVLISGRDKKRLDTWFGNLNITIIAEHGIWLKEKENKRWTAIEQLRADWKNEIRPILQLFVNRVPGSFIEEKEFSLAWHYRNADMQTGSSQARELMTVLTLLSANLEIGVLQGNMVVEIKNIGINKGRAALHILSNRTFQFILAIGDDFTDEALFRILPENSYSIKVGISSSYARINLMSQREVIPLLTE